MSLKTLKILAGRQSNTKNKNRKRKTLKTTAKNNQTNKTTNHTLLQHNYSAFMVH